MKRIVMLSLGMLLAYSPVAVLAQSQPSASQSQPAKKKPGKKAAYVCPMDGYRSAKPGKCPKCGMDLQKQEVPKGARQDQAGLTRIEAKFVCMMNNRRFEKEQIPIEVGGQMYYGCCEGCKKSLQQDAALRSAIDPVSQQPVDKATAVIGARNDGTVLYFESEDTMKSYLAAQKP
jgi:YHS domain-containing protein